MVVVIESLHRVRVTMGEAATPIVIVLLMAGFPLVQVRFEVSVQVIRSPFTGTYWKVLLFVPAFIPLTFHR